MATKVIAAVALVMAAGCDVMYREMYDDTPGEMELMYPEQNYVDSMKEPASTSTPLTRNSQARKMMQNKMQALRNHDASPSFLSVPKWISRGAVLVPRDTFDYSPIQGQLGSMFKRREDDKARPRLLRWKIKKGKAGKGSHMICYLKLCSFRPLS